MTAGVIPLQDGRASQARPWESDRHDLLLLTDGHARGWDALATPFAEATVVEIHTGSPVLVPGGRSDVVVIDRSPRATAPAEWYGLVARATTALRPGGWVLVALDSPRPGDPPHPGASSGADGRLVGPPEFGSLRWHGVTLLSERVFAVLRDRRTAGTADGGPDGAISGPDGATGGPDAVEGAGLASDMIAATLAATCGVLGRAADEALRLRGQADPDRAAALVSYLLTERRRSEHALIRHLGALVAELRARGGTGEVDSTWSRRLVRTVLAGPRTGPALRRLVHQGRRILGAGRRRVAGWWPARRWRRVYQSSSYSRR